MPASRKKPPTKKPAARARRRPSFASRLLRALALIGLVLGLALSLSWAIEQGYISTEQLAELFEGSGSGTEPAQQPPPIAQSGDIEIYFTSPSLTYPDVPRNRVPPPHELALIADIDSAIGSIEFATFEYNLVSIAEALARAEARGVTVRLALDRESVASPPMGKWAGIVEDAKIPIAWEDSDAFLHSKFLIVDRKLVWTGSWNATINDTYRNNNNLLRLSVAALVENYSAEFEQLFARIGSTSKKPITPYPQVRVGDVQIANYFSPQDSPERYVVERIAQAKESVRFLTFSFTSDLITEAMIARQEAGLRVEGVMEQRNAEGVGSEYGKLRMAGIEVLRDGNCYTMHHKIIIIDERTVITGSFNFTARANELNVENLLIIDDPAIAARYSEEFARVWRQAESPTRCN